MISRIKTKKDNGNLRVLAGISLKHLIPVFILFLAVGRIAYWQGWFFGVFNLFLLLTILVMSKRKKDFANLFQEQLNVSYSKRWWDKTFWILYWIVYFALIILAGLDAGRFRWSIELPFSVYGIVCLSYVVSHIIIFWAMWTNRFFYGTILIQTEKGHEVIQNGPYKFIRHPGYIGGILLLISTPVVLGSLWAIIPACINVILLILRTRLEDTILQTELMGYSFFAKQVRYRLLPSIW